MAESSELCKLYTYYKMTLPMLESLKDQIVVLFLSYVTSVIGKHNNNLVLSNKGSVILWYVYNLHSSLLSAIL